MAHSGLDHRPVIYATRADEDDDEPSSPPLNLIASDDDARCMINEFNKLKSRGMPTRLRTLECDDDGFVNYVGDTENLNGEHGSGGDTKKGKEPPKPDGNHDSA
ncbi:mitogen-activated protein kinase kinase kinase [Sarracenia purpurea var. burkii]